MIRLRLDRQLATTLLVYTLHGWCWHGSVSQRKNWKGQHVDVSMFDVIFSFLENAIVNYTVGGFIPERNGNVDPSIAPFDVYTL